MSPNYAFERSMMDVMTTSGDCNDYSLGAELRAWCPAQRER